jgi:5-methylcytosine-specific restriction endonuclease McrA
MSKPAHVDGQRWHQQTRYERLSSHHYWRAKKLNNGKPHGFWTADQWLLLVAAYQNYCSYCHKRFPTSELTPDHRIPLSREGNNNISNIVPSCLRCNQRKGRKTQAEFLAATP